MSKSIQGKQTCILVLGMHRSGTSALTGLLQKMGVYLGEDLLPANEFNPKGYFENRHLVALNDEILTFLDSSYDDPMPLYEGWVGKCEDFVEKAIDIIKEYYKGNSLIVIKDPRICVLFPFWEMVFDKLQIKLKCILPIRNPFHVAESLGNREGFNESKSLMLWCKYFLQAEYVSRSYPRLVLTYEMLTEKTLETAKLLSNFLEIPIKDESIISFVDKSLDHGKKQGDKYFPDIISSLINLVLSKGFINEPSFFEGELDNKRSELIKLSNIYKNLRLEENKSNTISSQVTNKKNLALIAKNGKKIENLMKEKESLEFGMENLEYALSRVTEVSKERLVKLEDCGAKLKDTDSYILSLEKKIEEGKRLSERTERSIRSLTEEKDNALITMNKNIKDFDMVLEERRSQYEELRMEMEIMRDNYKMVSKRFDVVKSSEWWKIMSLLTRNSK